MTTDEITAATNSLVSAVRDSAVTSGNDNEARVVALAPGLSTGSNAPGGYNYQRNVAPTVDPMADNLVIGAKQAIFKQALKQALGDAQGSYDTAKAGYTARQRKYYRDQAIAAANRQKAQDAQAAVQAKIAAAGSNTGAVIVNKAAPVNPLVVTGGAAPAQGGGVSVQGGVNLIPGQVGYNLGSAPISLNNANLRIR